MGPVAAVRVFVAAHIFFVNTVVTTDLILRLDRQSGAVEILEFLALGVLGRPTKVAATFKIFLLVHSGKNF